MPLPFYPPPAVPVIPLSPWPLHNGAHRPLGGLVACVVAQAPPENQIRDEANARLGLVNGWQRGGEGRYSHHCDELYPPGGWDEPPGTPPVRAKPARAV